MRMWKRVYLPVMLLVGFAQFGYSQPERGKAELAVKGGTISVDYGRPSLQGRDMLGRLQIGGFWRMGMNQATTLVTPVDLSFGTVKIPKGSYSLWLLRSGDDNFQLVFNSQTGQWGSQHDPAKDVAKVSLKKTVLPNPVETFTIDLKGGPDQGVFSMSWGDVELSAEFTVD